MMQNSYDEATLNETYKDKRLYKAEVKVCDDNVLVDRQIINSILESIMSLETLGQQLLEVG
jgi:hypothetical protein